MSTPLPPGAHPPPAPIGSHPVREPGDASVGELIGSVTRDLSTLMRQELALAKAELTQEAAKTGKAAGALGGAGFAAFFVVLFLSIALWSGLSNVMDPGWAGLVVALLWAVIAAVLFVIGRSTLRRVHPKPERTVETLSTVPDALRGHRGGTS
ncbi:phage holin family protein [Pseudonocardia saturnea]